MSASPSSFSVIGAGALASALVPAWVRAGATLRSVYSRDRSRAEALRVRALAADTKCCDRLEDLTLDCDMVLIAVPDQFIASLAQDLAPNVGTRIPRLCVHASGVHSADVLAVLAARGSLVASMHPLLALPPALSAEVDWRSVAFGIEGSAAALALTREWIERLQARSFVVRAEAKALYHASAVLASNDLVALLHAAQGCLALAAPDAPPDALLGLAASALRALQERRGDCVRALSGPLRRGDVATVLAHLEALRAHAGSGAADAARLLQLYELLLQFSLPLALEARGIKLDPAALEHLETALQRAASTAPPAQS